jgi:hypothetical protein
MTTTVYCQGPGCKEALPPHLPSNARYCSTACKSAAQRERRALGRDPAVSPHPDGSDTAFKRLQGDAVLSRWRPTGDGRDVPDIPDFLRRDK